MTLCPCDQVAPPLLKPIAPGLGSLPRQIGLFGNYRADLLARVGARDEFTEWRARDSEDFGLMLLDFWAYVADVVSFYTSERAQDLYLQTARGDQALRRITALLDYVPRPAVASEAVLAALVDGSDVVLAPARSAFISDAFDGVPPQEFELALATALDPLRNAWTLVPPRDRTFRPALLLIEPASRNMAEGAMIVIDAGPAARKATKILSLNSEPALDGATYLRLMVADPSALPPAGSDSASIRLWSFAQAAPVSSLAGTLLTLAGHYPQLRANELAVIEDRSLDNPLPPETGSILSATLGFGAPVTSGSGPGAVTVPGPPITTIALSWSSAITAANAVLHFGRARAGQLAAPFKTSVTPADFLEPLAIKAPAAAPKLAGVGEILVKGTGDLGVRVAGDVKIDPETGRGLLLPSGTFRATAEELDTPVNIHGNLLRVTRGKTVEEVVGSGAGAGVPFQQFTLAKFPLTYERDRTAAGGRRSSLRLWIDGVEWREVASLFTASSTDRVFIVRLDAKGQATVTTGGEGYGMPAPKGVQNVYALYRFGAGEPAPGPNRIRQVEAPVPGLRRVFNVSSAFGGSEADNPEDVRFNAPATAATFDRAVSAGDFGALARDWGALAASARTEWVPSALREGVVVTAIFASAAAPEDLSLLKTYLADRAAEGTPIRIVAAEPVRGELRLAYRPSSDTDPRKVRAALTDRFEHPFTGLLAPRRAEVGGPVFRSAILAAAAAISGVADLLALDWRGSAMPVRLGLPAHGYFAPTLLLDEVLQ